MSLTATIQNSLLQSLFGLTSGALVETAFNSETNITDENVTQVLMQVILQLGTNGLLASTYFDFASRQNSPNLRNDPTKGVLLTLTLVATQPNMMKKLAGLSKYFATTLRNQLGVVPKSTTTTTTTSAGPSITITPGTQALEFDG